MISIEQGNASLAKDMSILLQTELTKPDSLEELRHVLDNYPSFVAFDEIRVLKGLLYTWATGRDVLHIHGLHVHKDLRNEEIGSLLLDKTEVTARNLGYRTITLTNSMHYQGVDKRSAVPFYKKHGYRVIHETFNFPPTYIMLKEL